RRPPVPHGSRITFDVALYRADAAAAVVWGTARRTRPGAQASSGPELALEAGLRLLQGAAVGAGRQVLPAAVGDDEDDVGPLARLDRLPRHPQRRVQRAAGRDAREDALLLQQLAGAAQRVPGRDGEPGGQHRLVVQLRDEALVDVAQPVHQVAVTGLRGDDLDVRHLLAQVPAHAHQRARGAETGDEVRHRGEVLEDLGAGRLVVREGV